MKTFLFLVGALGLAFVSTIRLSGADGAQLAKQLCVACHGEELMGGQAPGIRGGKWRRAHNDAEAMQIILHGLPERSMPAFEGVIAAADRAALLAYVRSPAPKPGLGFWSSSRRPKEFHTELQDFRIEQVAVGFEVPWSLAFLPDGRFLVTERAGGLRVVDHGKVLEKITGTPRVWYRQDGGMLSLALDPDYAKNGWIYLSYSDPGQIAGTSMTKIVRGRIADQAWVDQQVIWQAEPGTYRGGDDHYGCRLLFHEGKLFFSVGDRGDRANAQNLSSPCGKVHRINPDGSIPSDNPFVGTPQAIPSIWSYGHRNPQGLAIDYQTGELWETEHGPMGGDELNHIHAGQNYGWPVVTFGLEHSGAIISKLTSKPGMVDPVTQWTPSIAVCPLYFSVSDFYPKWKHQILVGSLNFQEFRRVEVKGDQVLHQEILFKGLGRIRDIRTGPDGYLYLALEQRDGPGEIIRLVPLP